VEEDPLRRRASGQLDDELDPVRFRPAASGDEEVEFRVEAGEK